jgi:hypothetical protein
MIADRRAPLEATSSQRIGCDAVHIGTFYVDLRVGLDHHEPHPKGSETVS